MGYRSASNAISVCSVSRRGFCRLTPTEGEGTTLVSRPRTVLAVWAGSAEGPLTAAALLLNLQHATRARYRR